MIYHVNIAPPTPFPVNEHAITRPDVIEIIPLAADQNVCIFPGHHGVAPIPAFQTVLAGGGDHEVVTAFAEEVVVARFAEQVVVAAAAIELVVTAKAVNLVIKGGAQQGIVGEQVVEHPGQGIVASTANQCIGSGAAE